MRSELDEIMSSELHEILAVEGDLESTVKRTIGDVSRLFGKAELFTSAQKNLTMFADDRQNENTSERKEMSNNVEDLIAIVLKECVVRYYDATLQKELANQKAKADLIVDGNVIMSGLPATFLLGLETKLKALKSVFELIPVLPPGVTWDEAPELGKGVYKAKYPTEAMKTAKAFKFQIIVPATEKFPAQAEKWEEAVPVGKYITTVQSSMMSAARKAVIINKVEKLIAGAKQARQRANRQTVDTAEIGNILFGFILS